MNVDYLMALLVPLMGLFALVDSVPLPLVPLLVVPWTVHFPCRPSFGYLDGTLLLPLLH